MNKDWFQTIPFQKTLKPAPETSYLKTETQHSSAKGRQVLVQEFIVFAEVQAIITTTFRTLEFPLQTADGQIKHIPSNGCSPR